VKSSLFGVILAYILKLQTELKVKTMPILTSWYDEEHQVIGIQFEGNWGWDELRDGLKEESELAASVSHNLVAFVDMSHTKGFPKGNIIAQGRSTIVSLPNNITQIVVVIQSRLIEVFAGLIIDMMPAWRNRVKFVKTNEEGRTLVAEAVSKNTVGSVSG
jgi:hypothetical protein